MTRVFVILGLVGVVGASAPPAAAQQPRRDTPPRLISPEVHADRKVTFRISAPRATEVTVRGDWLSGPPVKLEKGDKGVWSATVGPLTPDLYSYAFTVDG